MSNEIVVTLGPSAVLQSTTSLPSIERLLGVPIPQLPQASAGGGSMLWWTPSDPTGATEMSGELKAIQEAHPNQVIGISPSTPMMNDYNPSTSLLLWAMPGTVRFKYKLNHSAIDWTYPQTYSTANTTRLSVSSLAKAVANDSFSTTSDNDLVSALSVADASGVKPGDLWVITSNDTLTYPAATGKFARYGEAFEVSTVDYAANIIYASEILEWHTRYVTSVAINKVPNDLKCNVFGIDAEGMATQIGNQLGTPDVLYGTQYPITGITRSSTTATVTTGTAHNLAVGNYIRVQGANEASYNQTGIVTAILTATTFTYTVSAKTDAGLTQSQSPATPATGSSITYQPVFANANNQNHSAAFNVVCAVHAKFSFCNVHKPWAGAFRMNNAPFFDVSNCNTRFLPNAMTANNNVGEGRLGYGLIAYGWCYGGVFNGGVHHNGRHVVTTGCAELTSYSSSNWNNGHGQPTNCTFTGQVCYDQWGPAGDTHEEASGMLFSDWKVFNPRRGPQEGSYDSYGMQIRSRNSRIRNYYQKGGGNGIRYAYGGSIELDSIQVIDNAFFDGVLSNITSQGCIVLSARSSSGTVYSSDQLAPVKVGKVQAHNCGTVLVNQSGQQLMVAEAYVTAPQGYISYAEDGGTTDIAHLTADYQDSPSTLSLSMFQAYGTSSTLVRRLDLTQGTTANLPGRMFNDGDSTPATKTYGLGSLSFSDPTNVGAPLIMLQSDMGLAKIGMFGGSTINFEAGDPSTTLAVAKPLRSRRTPSRFLMLDARASVDTPSTSGAIALDINRKILEATGDGTTAAFAMTQAPLVSQTNLNVFVGGALQVLTTNYTVATNVITFKAGFIPASGALIEVFDSIFSTNKLTIDQGQKTSRTSTVLPAWRPAAHYFADDAEINIDCDVAGTGAKGAKVTLRGYNL